MPTPPSSRAHKPSDERRYATYRGAMIGGMVANTAFGFIQVAVLIAVWNQNPGGIGGYDTTDATTTCSSCRR